MKIFYIEDDNGEFMSINGKRRFTRLIGKKAMGFLNSKNGKRRFFLKTESNEYDVLNYFVDEIFIEVPSEKVSEIPAGVQLRQGTDECRNARESRFLKIARKDKVCYLAFNRSFALNLPAAVWS